ncbi:MAG TPA: nuclear transport factor 2 family protein, partial [Steroidobacteraceae bacterium]
MNCLVRVLMILFLCSGAAAQANDRAQIEKLVRDSLASWETGDEQAFLATAHPDLTFAFPGTRTDAKGALEVFRYWREHFENTKVYVHWILVDGSRFVAEYQFATTSRKSGKRTVGSTAAIGEVRDGKIVLLKEYTDGRVTRLQEAGELPLDEGDEPYP